METKPKLPDKLYFKIGEVSKILGVHTHVLRYWESEFPSIKPTKSKSGQRIYKRSDIEVLSLIKDLLYRQKFTIEGARKYLKNLGIEKSLEEKEKRDQSDIRKVLDATSMRIENLKNILDRMEKKLLSTS
jgi:DNA-binding transcriptional MerR regulator